MCIESGQTPLRVYGDAREGHVISEHGTWRPGVFETREAAIASCKLTDEQIDAMQAEANLHRNGIITEAEIWKALNED